MMCMLDLERKTGFPRRGEVRMGLGEENKRPLATGESSSARDGL